MPLPKWVRDLNEVELSNLLDKEFKVIVIKMLTKLGRRIDEFSKNFNKEIENILKVPNRSYNENEKLLEGVQQQTG